MIRRSHIAVLASLLLLPTLASAEPWDGQQRWGVGCRASGLGLHAEADPEDTYELGGAGVQGRYRLNARWELEIGMDRIRGEREDGLERDLRFFTLGALFHINPQSQWTWSVVAGLGGAREDVSQDGKGEAEFQHGHGYLGVALERRFENFGIAAQVRAVGLSRDEEKLDGPVFAGRDVPIPEESSGGQLSLMASYYF